MKRKEWTRLLESSHSFDGKDFPKIVHLLLLRKRIEELGIYDIPGPIVESNAYNPETDYILGCCIL